MGGALLHACGGVAETISTYGNRVGGPQFLSTMLSRAVLTSGDTLNYVCGLEYGTHRGLPTLSHSGWWAGYLAYMVRFPEQRTTVVLLANSTSDILPSRNCYRIADIFLRDRFPPDQRPGPETRGAPPAEPAEAMVAPALYDQYAGLYEIGNLAAVVTVTRDGRRLMAQVNGQRFQLFPASDSTFFLKVDVVQVKFRRDERGEVSGLVWCQGGGEDTFNRIAPSLTAGEAGPYCGEYRSEDLQSTWSVLQDEGWLKVRSPLRTMDPSGTDILLRKEGDLFLLSDMALQFARDGNGQVTGFDLTRRGTTWQVNFGRK